MVQSDIYNEIISKSTISAVTSKPTFEERVNNAADLFINCIQNISERVPKPEVIICALSQEIVDFCTVNRSSSGALTQKKTKEERKLIKILKKHEENKQEFLDNEFEEIANQLLHDAIGDSNFWKKIKIAAMKFGIPTQIVHSSTVALKNELKGNQKRQDDSTTAWNLAVALYYKGSGLPWTMTKMEKDTCYVGISFFKDINDQSNLMRTSLAQVFTYTGEGLILRGDEFEWNLDDRSPHLSEDNACKLLHKVIEVYTRHMKCKPTRVVVHKSSRYWTDEKRGFEKALKEINYYDLITIEPRGVRFFRYGNYPPLRGTAIKLDSSNYLLYTRGYIPYLRTYPGPYVPLPLEILEHHGDFSQENILTEILSLSKMNWNSADFAMEKPITLLFSERVGRVMASLPKNIEPRHEYRYYM